MVRVVRLLKAAQVVRVAAALVVQVQAVIQEQALRTLAAVVVEYGTQQQAPTAVLALL